MEAEQREKLWGGERSCPAVGEEFPVSPAAPGEVEGRTCVLPKALPRRTSEVQFRNLEEALSRRGGAAQWKVNKRGAGLEAR